MRRFLLLSLLAGAACSAGPGPAGPAPAGPAPAAERGAAADAAPAPPPGGADAAPGGSAGLYTDEQAERGRGVFRRVCAECHYTSEVRGEEFLWEWGRRTVGDLYRSLVRTMPDDDPGALPPSDYVDVVSYILRLNGFRPGPRELTVDGPGFAARLTPPGA